MNYFSFYSKAKVLKKTFSIVALVALLAGGVSGVIYTSTAYANNGVNTSAVPNSGTLTAGQTMEVYFSEPSGTTDAITSGCLVNDVDVAGTFVNVSPGTYKVTYTVGASDASRAAGTVPINCTLSQTASVTVTAFDDGNTVAIDPTGGSGGPVAPAISGVSVMPSSGIVEAGDVIEAYFETNASDLAVTGTCHVNGVDASGSFVNVSGNQYKVTYTVGASDGERPAGNIPIGCTMGNSAGNATASGWTDSNTLSIDTNGDGTIDNGTNTLGFTVTADPSTGTLNVGESVQVYMQDPLPSGDVVIGSAGCRVNDVDVSGSYVYQGNGLYRVTYTAALGNASRAAGQIPFDCTLQNNTGSVHLTSFTDGNTLAIDASGGGGGSAATSSIAVEAIPNSGTLTAGQNLEVYFEATSTANNLTLGGSCTVNAVDVAGSFQNLTGGLYKVTYTIGSSDAERAAGTVPIGCVLTDGTNTESISAFTDGNTIAIDTNNDGTVLPPTGAETPFVESVTIDPTTGTITTGGHVDIFIQEGTDNTTFNVATGTCMVNDIDVGYTFSNMGTGLYKVTYNVSSTDTPRSSGTIPISCTLGNTSGQQLIVNSLPTNTLAIAFGTTTGTTTDEEGSATTTHSISVSAVSALSAHPILSLNDILEVYVMANKGGLILGDTCLVNDVDVTGSFQDLSGGLYRLMYTVGSNHSDRAPGTIPIDCTLLKESTGTTTRFTSFTDGNDYAIDVNADGVYGTTTGTTTNGTGGNDNATTSTSTVAFSSVYASPNSGTLTQGQTLQAFFEQATTSTGTLSLGGSCTINNVNVGGTFTDLSGGLYRVTYTVGSGDADRAAGQVPLSCVFQNNGYATTTVAAFTVANIVAIDVNNDGTIGTTTGTIGGDVVSGGALSVSSIVQEQSTAVAGGGFAQGWEWVFRITVPADEPNVSMKFDNWSRTNGTGTIPTANNMRISSAQASSTSPVTITAANTYSNPLVITGDLDPNAAGRQIEVRVEMRVPADTPNGSYITNYGVRSSE